jgi:hypothetical protein
MPLRRLAFGHQTMIGCYDGSVADATHHTGRALGANCFPTDDKLLFS